VVDVDDQLLLIVFVDGVKVDFKMMKKVMAKLDQWFFLDFFGRISCLINVTIV